MYTHIVAIFDTHGGMVRAISGAETFDPLLDGVDATLFTKQQVLETGVTQEEIDMWIEKAITDHSWQELASTWPHIHKFIKRVRV